MTPLPENLFKELLHARLKQDRQVLWHKASGLPEWQQRMPGTPTGTNLLGLVKHVALVEADYFGDCWGDPVPGLPEYVVAWDEHPELEDDDDLWAFPEESPKSIFTLAAQTARHADRLIDSTPLEANGFVPWWGEPGSGGREATLAELLIHMLGELSRHLGHADIVREQLDGSVGMREGAENLPEQRTPEQWAQRHQKLVEVAQASLPPAR